MTAKSVFNKGPGCKSGGCALKAVELASSDKLETHRTWFLGRLRKTRCAVPCRVIFLIRYASRSIRMVSSSVPSSRTMAALVRLAGNFWASQRCRSRGSSCRSTFAVPLCQRDKIP